MSSTVTASARQYTAANSESHSITDAAQTNLDPSGNTDFYIATWVYLDTKTAAQSFVAKYDFNSNQRCYRLEYDNTADRFLFRVSSDGTSTNLFTATASTFGSPSTATWYFLQAYHDATNDVIAVSVNNGTFDTTANTLGVADKAVPFFIGNNSNAQPTNGRIAQTLFALGIPASGERASLYNSGNGVLYKDRPTFASAAIVSWWDGAETSGVRIDAHGSNHLTDNNTVTSAAGKVTYTAEDASQFTSANSEYLSTATSGVIAPGDKDFSITGWVYFDTIAANMGIVSELDFGGAFGNNYSWVLLFVVATSKIRFDIDSLGTAGAGLTSVSSLNTVSASKWYFFAVRHDATGNTIELRINGEAWQSAAHSGGAYAGTAPLRIGAYGITSVTALLNGRASNVNYWDSKISDALTDELYARGFGEDYSDVSTTTNLGPWWGLKEASGNRSDSNSTFTLTDNNTVTGAAGVVYDVPSVVGGASFLQSRPISLRLGLGL